MKQDLQQLHTVFLRECEFVERLSPDTIRGYQASFDLLVKLIPTLRLETLSPGMMTEFFERLEKRKRIVGKGVMREGIKKSTTATYRSKLNKYFNWLRIKGYIRENPLSQLPHPHIRYEDRKFLKREHIEKIFAAVALHSATAFLKRRNTAIFSVLLNCGLRRNELVSVRAFDVDLERRALVVRAETSKSKRERVVPLNSMVLGHLKEGKLSSGANSSGGILLRGHPSVALS